MIHIEQNGYYRKFRYWLILSLYDATDYFPGMLLVFPDTKLFTVKK